MKVSRLEKRTLLAGLALLFLTTAAGVIATEEAPLTPKGIYHAVDEYHRTGVKFLVELRERGKKPRRVPVTHGFQTGDRFTFNFEINRDSFIYVINQTVRGTMTASGIETTELRSKGIERVSYRVEPPAPPPPSAPRLRYVGKPRLLFPTTRAGSNNRLKGDLPYPVPHRGHYVMDDLTGTEKLYVIISDRRLDFSRYFYGNSGRVRGSSSADRLRGQLEEWKKNAEVELVDKGILHDVASYGVSIDPTKPAVVEIDLRHCR